MNIYPLFEYSFGNYVLKKVVPTLTKTEVMFIRLEVLKTGKVLIQFIRNADGTVSIKGVAFTT